MYFWDDVAVYLDIFGDLGRQGLGLRRSPVLNNWGRVQGFEISSNLGEAGEPLAGLYRVGPTLGL